MTTTNLLAWLAVACAAAVAVRADGDHIAFAAAGDFGHERSDVFDAIGELQQCRQLDFGLAVGDFSYQSDGQAAWCQQWRDAAGITNLFLTPGNHDVENDDMQTYVAQCPLEAANADRVVGLYPYRWYVDAKPWLRIIAIVPGLEDSATAWASFGAVSDNLQWLRDTINDAFTGAETLSRNGGRRPWVVVSMHKIHISAINKNDEVGQPLFDLLLGAEDGGRRVDLVLHGHAHNYQRSFPLTCARANSFEPACVGDEGLGADMPYVQGQGTVVAIVGNGGRDLVGGNAASDREAGYFARVDTKHFGFVHVDVTRTRLEFAYHRAGGGTCTTDSVLDSFSIAGPPADDGELVAQAASLSPSLSAFASLSAFITQSLSLSASTSASPSPSHADEEFGFEVCSGHGVCLCDDGWAGIDCSLLLASVSPSLSASLSLSSSETASVSRSSSRSSSLSSSLSAAYSSASPSVSGSTSASDPVSSSSSPSPSPSLSASSSLSPSASASPSSAFESLSASLSSLLSASASGTSAASHSISASGSVASAGASYSLSASTSPSPLDASACASASTSASSFASVSASASASASRSPIVCSGRGICQCGAGFAGVDCATVEATLSASQSASASPSPSTSVSASADWLSPSASASTSSSASVTGGGDPPARAVKSSGRSTLRRSSSKEPAASSSMAATDLLVVLSTLLLLGVTLGLTDALLGV